MEKCLLATTTPVALLATKLWRSEWKRSHEPVATKALTTVMKTKTAQATAADHTQ
jgi:hypothetical protein